MWRMTNKTLFSYADLTPDCVIQAVDSVGLHADGRLLALNSYENRVYLVGVEGGGANVVKFYRPSRWSDEAILEEHDFVQELASQEIPAVPALTLGTLRTLHHHQGFRFAVFPMQGGRAPELDAADTRERLGRFIGRIHAVGASRVFRHRVRLDIARFGEAPLAYLLENNFLPPELEVVYRSVAQQAIDGVRRCFDRAEDIPWIRLHGDCHVGNVLWTDAGPHFVDFDDCLTGPPLQDLWMLLSGNREEMSQQLHDLLTGYTQFAAFDSRQLHLLEGLRTLRLIHYSAWLARRWDDPAFPLAFPWFNTQRYWQDRILELREQVALMDEPPLAAC